jgi:hypothetical protein
MNFILSEYFLTVYDIVFNHQLIPRRYSIMVIFIYVVSMMNDINLL